MKLVERLVNSIIAYESVSIARILDALADFRSDPQLCQALGYDGAEWLRAKNLYLKTHTIAGVIS